MYLNSLTPSLTIVLILYLKPQLYKLHSVISYDNSLYLVAQSCTILPNLSLDILSIFDQYSATSFGLLSLKQII